MTQADLGSSQYPSPSDLDQLATEIRDAAQLRKGDTLALLSLLRMLEQVHRETTDGLFQDALPTNRQKLYSFLRDIENNGGWPYIHSRKLRVVLSDLVTALNHEESTIHLDPPDKSETGEDPTAT